MANISNISIILTLALVALVSIQTNGLSDSGDRIKHLLKSMGRIELDIVEARVPDMDPLPLQGDSDVFVKVYYNNTNELLCQTKIIQDDNSPKVSTLTHR